ncbi:MAG: mandelate racemase/muconate lactonizing enzyme family protein [Planctomycetales bacterium]|jgi:galactonate dehydratase|nr:mandelate racemase/muconate lactonizing enzyme family protein [Planctomycetales bacterium]
MKISSIRAHVMGIASPGGSAPSRNWIFVRVETDEGIVGVGEATTEYHEMAVVAMIEHHFAPLLVGQDPTQVHRAWQQMQRLFWWRGGIVASSAASGIEQALWDVTGKAYNLPVYKLLGGAVRDRIRLYARGDLGLGSLAAEAKTAVDEGFDAFKLGTGAYVVPYHDKKQVDVALEAARKVRAAVGTECDLMMDCGGIFSLQEAHRLIEGLADVKTLFVEEPVNMDTPQKLIELRRACPGVRIAAGERLVTRWQFREWLEKGAVDIIQADISHCGGIGELLRIASYAEVYGIQVAPHNPYGPVAMAANIHAAVSMPNFLILEHCRHRPWFNDVQRHGHIVDQGYVIPNDRPGLGIELDWDYVRKYPYQPLKLRTFINGDGALPLI